MSPVAHIGNVPIEEWLPFLVPIVALYLYGRRTERRRRKRVRSLLDAGPLDAGTTSAVTAAWSAADHRELHPEHLPLLCPPGPDGCTAAELAQRVHRDPGTVRGLIEDLAELGYVELDAGDGAAARAWLTPAGSDLINLTEDALLSARPPAPHGSDRR